jgi:hypothetical protein
MRPGSHVEILSAPSGFAEIVSNDFRNAQARGTRRILVRWYERLETEAR